MSGRDEKKGSAATRVVVIGGSAGSLTPVLKIVRGLPQRFGYALILVLHRQRNIPSEMSALLSAGRIHNICEPDDKSIIQPGCIYLAPQNYHLLLERNGLFSLDYSEPVLYSRPSIDVTLESAARAYGALATGIILSGANSDGAEGLSNVLEVGGTGLVQDPDEAEYPTMPEAAVEKNASSEIATLPEIVRYLANLV